MVKALIILLPVLMSGCTWLASKEGPAECQDPECVLEAVGFRSHVAQHADATVLRNVSVSSLLVSETFIAWQDHHAIHRAGALPSEVLRWSILNRTTGAVSDIDLSSFGVPFPMLLERDTLFFTTLPHTEAEPLYAVDLGRGTSRVVAAVPGHRILEASSIGILAKGTQNGTPAYSVFPLAEQSSASPVPVTASFMGASTPSQPSHCNLIDWGLTCAVVQDGTTDVMLRNWANGTTEVLTRTKQPASYLFATNEWTLVGDGEQILAYEDRGEPFHLKMRRVAFRSAAGDGPWLVVQSEWRDRPGMWDITLASTQTCWVSLAPVMDSRKAFMHDVVGDTLFIVHWNSKLPNTGDLFLLDLRRLTEASCSSGTFDGASEGTLQGWPHAD